MAKGTIDHYRELDRLIVNWPAKAIAARLGEWARQSDEAGDVRWAAYLRQRAAACTSVAPCG